MQPSGWIASDEYVIETDHDHIDTTRPQDAAAILHTGL